MNIIASADLKWGIGKGGDLLYHIPEDMRFFKEKTSGKTVIMGRATLDSLPGGKPLKNRRNIVLSTSKRPCDGVEICSSVEDALALVSEIPAEDVFVIGGESIYKLFLPHCDTAYITKVYGISEADRFLPDLDADSDWYIKSVSPKYASNGAVFEFITYKRR